MTQPAGPDLVTAQQSLLAQAALLNDSRRLLRDGLAKISVRRAHIDTAWRYYEGDHPALWMTDKMGDLFKGMASNLSDNLCGLAVDSVLNRLRVTGWTDTDPVLDMAGDVAVTQAQAAQALWSINSLDLEQEDLYRHALVSSVGYVLAWPDERGLPDVTVQDPRSTWVEYRGATGERLWGLRTWHDEGTWHANLYHPDRVVRLVVPGRSDSKRLPDSGRFVLDGDDPGGPSPLAVQQVALVPFQRRRGAPGYLKSLIPVQDKINKLAANKMVAAEFAAFRQRVFITTQSLPDNAITNAPDRAIVLDPGSPDAPTSVQEFAVTELSNYDQSIAAEVAKFATIAPLPRHLILGDGGAPPSGEQVKADEGPFVALVDAYVDRFGAAWSDVVGLFGIAAGPAWADTTVHNDEAVARTVKTFVDAGVPAGLALQRYAGWSEDEVAEVDAATSAQAVQAAAAGAVALAAFDQGADPRGALPPMA